MLILTGVKSPQLLPRSKEVSGISTATRRLAEFGILGSKADLASMKARGKTFVKPPEDTRPTWEERLKPLERTLASRKYAKTDEPKKKKDLDDLGLRRLL
jgi:hypothetical protein